MTSSYYHYYPLEEFVYSLCVMALTAVALVFVAVTAMFFVAVGAELGRRRLFPRQKQPQKKPTKSTQTPTPPRPIINRSELIE